MKQLAEAELMLYTSKSRADKAINSLKGILLGINMDGEVNENEVQELKLWALEHQDLIHRNPFREFMSVIDGVLSNGIPAKDSIEDLYWLCQKYETENYYYNAVTADLQTLQGICHGLLSDGKIHDEEVFQLDKWLNENEHLNSYYPYDELRSLVLSIVSDRKVDEEERIVLKAYLNQFVKLTNTDMKDQVDLETNSVQLSALCTSEPNVTFEGKTFCITGILKRGTREATEAQIRALGGIPTNSVTRKTDYLIVGDNGNQAWAFACYGRKVEKAMELRKGGHTITLIHEFDFADIIDDLI